MLPLNRFRSLFAVLALALPLGMAAPSALAQAAAAPAAVPGANLPSLNDMRLQLPRTMQALDSALGMGRQRLALVVGIGTLGARLAVDSVPRDVQAVTAALKAGGFVVIVREDVGGADLRAALSEFRTRLQPGGIGFVYFTGPGTQVEGQNLLLPRDAALGRAGGLTEWLRHSCVPLQEVIDALMGTPESLRILVVDAAYQHPALAGLPKHGLAEQKLPPGMMAMFSQAPDVAQEVPAVAPLPAPPPVDPRELAASRFTRMLVGALTTPRLNGPEVLRSTQRAVADATRGQSRPWISGDTDSKQDLAEAGVLESLIPRTPEDAAREALNQGARSGTRPGTGRAAAQAGERSVADVLEQPTAGSGIAPAGAPRPEPAAPGAGTSSSAAGALGAAASVAGAAAALAAGTQVAVASAALSATGMAAGAVGAAGGVAGHGVPAPKPTLPAVDGRTTRLAGGGERPVYTPRSNSFGYAEGDTFTYQVLDTWKGEWVGEYTLAIDEVMGDGQLLANGHEVQMDAQGRLKSQRLPDGSASKFEPAQELWWSNPKAGESRRVSFTETFTRAGGGRGKTDFKGSSKVGSLRKIETPAGEFDALPIETSGWYYETLLNGALSSGQFSRTVWYAPSIGHPVAIDIQDADRVGKLLKRERIELTHAQQSRGTP